MTSMNLWGSGGIVGDPRQTGMGMRSAPQQAVTMGQPFEVLTFGMFNRPIRGTSPSSRALRMSLTVAPPGEEPFVFSLDDPQSPRTLYGLPNPWFLGYSETDNTPPCDPAIQVTATPCDDLYSLYYDRADSPGDRPISVEKVVNGTIWRFDLLGFDDPLTGQVNRQVRTEERTETRVRVFGVLNRQGPGQAATTNTLTGPPASSPSGGPATFTATISPNPGGGTVAFSTDADTIAGCGTTAVTTQGTASCTTSALGPGQHTITARFAGTPEFFGSTSGQLVHTDGTPPTVINRSPVSGAKAVSIGANLTATFSEDVNGVYNSSAFTLRDTATGTGVAGVVSSGGNTNKYIFDPSVNLTPDTRYTATLTGGVIRDVAGNPLATTSWSFLTGPPPTVTNHSPGSGATAVSRAANITATFNEAVNGVTGSAFTLRNTATRTRVSGVVTRNGTTNEWIFDPSADLEPDTRYTATLNDGTTAIRDLAGNPLATTSWSFLTGPPPTVTNRSPGSGATAVSRAANITATFNEAVNGVAGTTFTLRNTATGTGISGVVTRNGTTNQWILNPGVNLAPGTRYTVTLTGGTTAIRDLAGNPLATTSWSFQAGG